MTLQYLLNKRCGTECVVQHYTTMLVEVRENVLAEVLRLQHMATRMYLKPFFCAGMQSLQTSGYLHLITAGREATDRGVFGRKFKWLELVASVKKQNLVLCNKIVVESNDNVGNNIYI